MHHAMSYCAMQALLSQLRMRIALVELRALRPAGAGDPRGRRRAAFGPKYPAITEEELSLPIRF